VSFCWQRRWIPACAGMTTPWSLPPSPPPSFPLRPSRRSRFDPAVVRVSTLQSFPLRPSRRSRAGGNPGSFCRQRRWIPACAGMTP